MRINDDDSMTKSVEPMGLPKFVSLCMYVYVCMCVYVYMYVFVYC